jgi:hypothetical protein
LLCSYPNHAEGMKQFLIRDASVKFIALCQFLQTFLRVLNVANFSRDYLALGVMLIAAKSRSISFPIEY